MKSVGIGFPPIFLSIEKIDDAPNIRSCSQALCVHRIDHTKLIMPPKTSRPPKAGSKKALELKEKQKATAGDGTVESGCKYSSSIYILLIYSQIYYILVFEGMSLKGGEPADEGRVATGSLVSELRARDIKVCTNTSTHTTPLPTQHFLSTHKYICYIFFIISYLPTQYNTTCNIQY
jgi:hypothetical protein